MYKLTVAHYDDMSGSDDWITTIEPRHYWLELADYALFDIIDEDWSKYILIPELEATINWSFITHKYKERRMLWDAQCDREPVFSNQFKEEFALLENLIMKMNLPSSLRGMVRNDVYGIPWRYNGDCWLRVYENGLEDE